MKCKLKIENIKQLDHSGIPTHASEETGALKQRLRPFGHAADYDAPVMVL